MLGAIIGDICGSIYEFNNFKDYNGIKLFARGCRLTDDSMMTIAVAKALMDTYGQTDDEIKKALIDSMHYYGKHFPDAGYGGSFRKWLFYGDTQPYNSWGNGSAMRVASVGWLYGSLDETIRVAKLTAEVTHNHPEGIKGAQAAASAIYFARNGYSKEKIKKEIISRFGYDLDFTIDEIRPEYSFDVSCQGTMPVALAAFLESNSFEDALRLALSVGGDSDTIACITCSIAEAFYDIPEKLCEKAREILKKEDNPNNSLLVSQLDRFIQFSWDKCIEFGQLTKLQAAVLQEAIARTNAEMVKEGRDKP